MRPWRREISESRADCPFSGIRGDAGNALRMAKYADSMPLYEIVETIKKLTAEKDNIDDYFDIFSFMVPRCSAL